MLRLLLLTAMFWISVSTEGSQNGPTDSGSFLEKRKRSAPRGYYGGLGYPYLSFAEPLTILAGLAFLAYVIQAFHAVYYNHNHGMAAGLLNNVLPPKGRNVITEATNQNKPFKLYDRRLAIEDFVQDESDTALNLKKKFQKLKIS